MGKREPKACIAVKTALGTQPTLEKLQELQRNNPASYKQMQNSLNYELDTESKMQYKSLKTDDERTAWMLRSVDESISNKEGSFWNVS